MSHQLSVLDRPGYLHFVVTGTNSRESVEAYLREVGTICEARRCRRILIEERLEGPRLGTIDVFAVASGAHAQAAARFDAIAFVDVNAGDGLMKFAEDVAVNRSVPVKVFATVEEAARWLVASAR
jgi:hypothetical protein